MKAVDLIEAIKFHIAELEEGIQLAVLRQKESVQEKAMMREYWLGIEASKRDEIKALEKIIGA